MINRRNIMLGLLKRLKECEKRISALESEVQRQRKEINFRKYPYEALKKAFGEVARQK